ncbi:polyketide cyclase [Mycobacterium avium subsp. paratuberculosis]|uniref:SRPBCC family protein n=1 Tax=Mycobacterium avium TaxID=1764 RepID=UPI0004CEDDFD|nr:SRPBCC family protein [Mycobacterium avium]QPM73479.1 polyketide cyclase [Mycobacterium avium subsp. paratuberculosis S397]QQK52215.1 polyketide cyclase [Mycobacterium avium subsp. paratuberculosis]WAI54503.1 SRPBCC family protein [Mycobacterium avium subsp. paratuberculosis]
MSDTEAERIVSATRVIAANAARIFELIADPARQPGWDGNDNLASAAPGQRVHRVGDVFKMTLTNGAVRENHVTEFVEGSVIAWRPAEPGKQPPGHVWRWELSPVNAELTTVTHTYDWTALTDPTRLQRARATTPEMLRESMDRLATLAQSGD